MSLESEVGSLAFRCLNEGEKSLEGTPVAIKNPYRLQFEWFQSAPSNFACIIIHCECGFVWRQPQDHSPVVFLHFLTYVVITIARNPPQLLFYCQTSCAISRLFYSTFTPSHRYVLDVFAFGTISDLKRFEYSFYVFLLLRTTFLFKMSIFNYYKYIFYFFE